MTERAQALEALKRVARDIGTVKDVASRRSDPDRDNRRMLARLSAWRSEILRALNILEAVPPRPPVGSPTTEDIPQLVQRFDLVSVSFAYTSDHEMERADDGEWVRFDDVFPPASLSTVEPTVHNDLCSWCLTQADHVAASEECYERNSERGRIDSKPPVEPAGATQHDLDMELARERRDNDRMRFIFDTTHECPPPPVRHVATCETNGHVYGHTGACVFCNAPKPVDSIPEE